MMSLALYRSIIFNNPHQLKIELETINVFQLYVKIMTHHLYVLVMS